LQQLEGDLQQIGRDSQQPEPRRERREGGRQRRSIMNPVNEMHAAVITYFAAEKRESLLFLLAGGAAIAASVYLWLTGSPYRAMGWPLTAVALIQLVVGWTVYARTDRQVRDLHALLAKDP
jgi:hypothetical protein